MTKAKPKLLIVEDQAILRLGLKLILDEFPDLAIVGDATDGKSAVEKSLELRPDLVLMDIGLPGMDGIEATAKLKGLLPDTRVIMFTSHEDDEDICAALSAGADGYCSKEISPRELYQAITAVLQGLVWFDRKIAQQLVHLKDKGHASKTDIETNKGKPSRAEKEILSLLEKGYDIYEIGKRTAVDVGTVSKYAHNIFLGLSTRHHDVIEPKATSLSKSDSKQAAKAKASQSGLSGLTVSSTFADRYLIQSVIGQGGMGIVYKAKHLHMDRDVAIKLLYTHRLRDSRAVKLFQQEAKAASSLNHPNIIGVFDFGVTHGGRPFLIMDYFPGDGLDEVLKREPMLEPARLLTIFSQACDALAAAHDNNIVHCDLKPSNIMIGKEQHNQDLVKIVDFGLARLLPTDSSIQMQLTDSFEVAGSPYYMSPEQCKSTRLDQRSDIYSLGCVMYEAVTGKKLFDGLSPLEVFSKHLHDAPERFASISPGRLIPEAVETVVFKALAKDPDERFQTARELKDELSRIAEQLCLA